MRPLTAIAALALTTTPALADVPAYRVDVVETYAVTTTVRGASEDGLIVGDQVLVGLIQPFAARLGEGLAILPLPDGYNSGSALDANDAGVIVGTVSTSSLPLDFGEPAVWTPDGAGGYDVAILEQFASLPSPIGGSLAISGGQAIAINNDGDIVGWSRFQGFQGGPPTRFFTDAGPVDLRDLGFDATPRDLSDSGFVVGDQERLDIDSGALLEFGVPDPIQPGNVGFTNAIAYSVNDAGEMVVAANLASVPTENWLTYTYNDAAGYERLNPSQLPARFVGFYDNNNRGDVSASGGVYFADENALFTTGYAPLLEAGSTNWTVALGFINDQREVFTTAFDPGADVNAIVVLTPINANPADLTGDGVVDASDLAALIAAWGSSGPADLDADGVVDAADLAALIAAWG
jgi:hypothetical protein